jgi:flagellar protein FliS
MIGAQSTAARYQQAQVGTADRGHLLLLMFDGGLKFLGQARASLAANDVGRFGYDLGRAQSIIAELMHTLDHAAGGQIAADLERLYTFMLDHLVEANRRKSVGHLDQVARLLDIVASAFREILQNGMPAVHAA